MGYFVAGDAIGVGQVVALDVELGTGNEAGAQLAQSACEGLHID